MGSTCRLPHFAVPAAARQAGAASIGIHRASSCSAGLGAGERWAGGRIEFVDGDDEEAAPPAAVTPDAVEPPPSGPALDASAATPAAEVAAARPPLGAAAAGAMRRRASAAAVDGAAALAGAKWKKLAGRALAEVRERCGSWAAVRCAFCFCALRLLGCLVVTVLVVARAQDQRGLAPCDHGMDLHRHSLCWAGCALHSRKGCCSCAAGANTGAAPEDAAAAGGCCAVCKGLCGCTCQPQAADRGAPVCGMVLGLPLGLSTRQACMALLYRAHASALRLNLQAAG